MATRREGREIEIAASGDESGEGADAGVRAYLATPASGHGPGVVVVQEWWGLVDNIRDVCDRLARSGFVALAPDLYRGESTEDPDLAGRLMLELDIARASSDLEAAVSTLLGHTAVDGGRVGCLGFCMGGQLALSAATRIQRIAAVVDCYGIHPKVELDLAGLEAAVFGVFAENDEFVPAEAVQELEGRLRASGKRARFNTYLGVRHGFLNDARPDVFDATMAAEAWNDILAFLHAELA